MKRTPLRRRAKLRARKPLRRSSSLQRTPSMAATDTQRAAVAGRRCIVCGTDRRIDPAHLIPRSLGGCGDALCVTAPAVRCHRAYDRGELDLLPYLEPAWRAQLAHAVGHVGLIGALRRISGMRGGPTRNDHYDRGQPREPCRAVKGPRPASADQTGHGRGSGTAWARTCRRSGSRGVTRAGPTNPRARHGGLAQRHPKGGPYGFDAEGRLRAARAGARAPAGEDRRASRSAGTLASASGRR